MTQACDTRDVEAAQRWAAFYRMRGWNPLPSRTDEKRPFGRYAQWWDEPAPADLFDRHPTTNVQLMTGRRWRLLVIDLDGPEAVAQWPRLLSGCPRTWVTHSGGGGRHLWFTVAADAPPLPKAVLWRPDPSKPREKGEPAVERLCDRSLIAVPPSIHPRTGRRYRFLAGCSPKDLAMPAPAPAALFRLRPVAPPRVEPAFAPARAATPAVVARPGAAVRTADVLDAIADKAGLAKSWGLRLASDRPNAAGWCECHAVGRRDDNPSASFSPSSGRYWEPDLGAVGFLDLAVMLGAYSTWQDARDDLAVRYRVMGTA